MNSTNNLLLLMPEVVWGGAEKQFIYLIDNCVADCITVICPHSYGGTVVGEGFFKNGRTKLIESDEPVKDKFAVISYYYKEIKKATKLKSYTAVLVYEAYSCYLIPYLKIKGIKVIYSERNSGDGVVHSRILKNCVKKADEVTANSEAAKILLENNLKKTITYIKNGICEAKTHDQKVLIDTIVVPARIARVKNQMIILEFMRCCTDFRGTVVFAGKNDDSVYFQELKNFIEIHNLTERVSFVGHISNMELLYNNADLVILPSYFEGMSNVILECFIRRIPILVSNITMNVFTDNLKKWSFLPDSVDELIKVFYQWQQLDKEQKNEIMDLNREYVLHEHSIKRMTECYEKLMMEKKVK